MRADRDLDDEQREWLRQEFARPMTAAQRRAANAVRRLARDDDYSAEAYNRTLDEAEDEDQEPAVETP